MKSRLPPDRAAGTDTSEIRIPHLFGLFALLFVWIWAGLKDAFIVKKRVFILNPNDSESLNA